jgi:creatinine amidohydrolase
MAVKVEPSSDIYQVFTDVIRYIPFSKRTPNGTIGDATIGTAEKGKALLDKCVARIADYMAHEFGIQFRS